MSKVFDAIASSAAKRGVRMLRYATGGAFAVAAAYGLSRVYARRLSNRRRARGDTGGPGPQAPVGPSAATSSSADSSLSSPVVNIGFAKQLLRLIRILIPGIFTKECAILTLHAVSLAVRAYLAVRTAQLDGKIVQAIVLRSVPQFLLQLGKWMAIGIPVTLTNSFIRYLESKLGLALRGRLVGHAYQLYFKDQTYYRISNLDDRLTNVDECLTEDVTTFASELSSLYAKLTKPCLDAIVMLLTLFRLARSRGSKAELPTLAAVVLVSATSKFLRALSPNFGRLMAEKGKLKGHLRGMHSKVIAHAEEVAFYGGNKVEEGLFRASYRNLDRLMDSIYQKRLWYITLEQFLMKYMWNAAGIAMIAIPILTSAGGAGQLAGGGVGNSSGEDVSERTMSFTTARSMLLNTANAIEQIMSSYKEVTELAGYTARVSEMFDVFNEVSLGRYVRRTMTSNAIDSSPRQTSATLTTRGKVVDTKSTVFLHEVPIITPNGDIITSELSLEVRAGMHLLIAGPNGCGKSSLFRVINGLWPLYGGTLGKPKTARMFYIPQRPYLYAGTLRDQVIYPDSACDMAKRGLTDAYLEEVLSMVHLDHIVAREGGWDSRRDWHNVLSGGEKQRVGLARLFYHRPHYALLDECTSAVSIDDEGRMYQAAKDAGMTLLTITHRPSLWKFHTHVLRFDGEGGWTLEELHSVDQQVASQTEPQTAGESGSTVGDSVPGSSMAVDGS